MNTATLWPYGSTGGAPSRFLCTVSKKTVLVLTKTVCFCCFTRSHATWPKPAGNSSRGLRLFWDSTITVGCCASGLLHHRQMQVSSGIGAEYVSVIYKAAKNWWRQCTKQHGLEELYDGYRTGIVADINVGIALYCLMSASHDLFLQPPFHKWDSLRAITVVTWLSWCAGLSVLDTGLTCADFVFKLALQAVL